MKNVIIAILSMCFASQVLAQVKPDMFEFIEGFENSTTIEAFSEKYSSSFHPYNDAITFMNQAGMFITELFSYNGNPSMQIVTINKNSGSVTFSIAPDTHKIPRHAYSKASADLKDYIISHLGKPIIEDDDITESKSIISLFVKDDIDSGRRHIWYSNENEPGYMGFSAYSKGTEYFILMVMFPVTNKSMATEVNTGFAKTPIQNIFFEHIELGKRLSSDLLGLYLNVNSKDIKVTKTSEGYLYQVMYNGYFGGRYWNLIELCTVDGMLSEIKFVCSTERDNSHIYKEMLKILINKYGEPLNFKETTQAWYDTELPNVLCLEYQYIPNMIGEMRHYVNLSYSNSELIRIGAEKATNEL